MKKFNKKSTIGELYSNAMLITDQDEADEYLECLIDFGMSFDQTREEAEKIQRENLSYYAGYHDAEIASRVNRLFRVKHPIFEDEIPIAEGAVEAGVKHAESWE